MCASTLAQTQKMQASIPLLRMLRSIQMSQASCSTAKRYTEQWRNSGDASYPFTDS